MATIDVKDAAGLTVALEKPLTPGAAAAASSRPVTLSTENVAILGATDETAAASDTATSGLNGRLQRIAQRLTALTAVFSNGTGTAAGAVRVVLPTDSPLPAGTNAIGKLSANSGVDIGDVDVASLPALAAGSNIIGNVRIDQTTPGTTNAVSAVLTTGSATIGKLAANSGVDIGDVDVTSLPALAAGSNIIGNVRIDQTTPGTTNAVSVSGVSTAANQTTLIGHVDGIEGGIGIVTETAPASDTASSGLNGRLQRIAQRLTTLIAFFVNGTGTAAAAIRTVAASDDPGVTSLAIVDDWDESDRAKVNLIVGQAGIAAGAGSVGATVPRVTHASDDPVTTALQIMDDWDESDRAKVNLIVGQAGIAAGAGNVAATVPRVTLAADDPLVAGVTRGVLTCTTTITRPSDIIAYSINDALSNSTSAPTSGGFTLTSVVAASGKAAILTDVVIVSSNAPVTPLQGELFIFDTAITNINDNAAFTISDAEMLTCVARVPFALETIGANSSAHISLSVGILTVASANLRFAVRVLNAYTPASAETLTIRAKFHGVN